MRQVHSIRALPLRMDEEAARKQFMGTAPVALLRNLTARRLSRLALVMLPFWTYGVQVESLTFRERYWLSLDALKATLDPYRIEAGMESGTGITQSSNCVPAALSQTEMHERVVESARRAIYLKGFGRIRELKINATRLAEEDFHVPFWLGFYGEDDLTFAVLNANTGRREGGKVAELFREWLVSR
jgi:hypothetical protein